MFRYVDREKSGNPVTVDEMEFDEKTYYRSLLYLPTDDLSVVPAVDATMTTFVDYSFLPRILSLVKGLEGFFKIDF
jgi:hypothetical protein